MSKHKPITAVLDIGSHAAKLNIIGPDGEMIAKPRSHCNLGRNLFTEKHSELPEDGVRKLLDDLKTFRRHVNDHKADITLAFITGAVRILQQVNPAAADNFVQRAAHAFGGTIHIISGQIEGEMHGHAIYELHRQDGTAIGTGGTTTQIVAIQNGQIDPKEVTELRLGLLSLINQREIRMTSLRRTAASILREGNVPRNKAYRQPRLYASNSTLDKAIAIIHHRLDGNKPVTSHPTFEASVLLNRLDTLLDKPKKAFPGELTEDHQKILASAAILHAVINAIQPEEVVISPARPSHGVRLLPNTSRLLSQPL